MARFGKPPECPAVHSNHDNAFLVLALIAAMPRSCVTRIAHAMVLAHGGNCLVMLDTDEKRAMRAWKRAVQPRRTIPGGVIDATETLIGAGLVSWSNEHDYEVTAEGLERLARPELAWWRWEAALLAPITLRMEAWLSAGMRGRHRANRSEEDGHG